MEVVPIAEGILRLLRLVAERLLISQSVFRRPSLLLPALAPRPLVRLFMSIQLPVCRGFLSSSESNRSNEL